MHALGTFIASIPTDWFVIGALFAAAAIDTWRSGSGRVATVVCAFPIALFFVGAASQAVFLSGFSKTLSASPMHLIFFALVFAAIYAVLDRVMSPAGYDGHLTVSALIAGLVGVVVVLGFWMQIPETTALWHFSAPVRAVFGGGWSFWWIVGGYSGLVYLRS